MIDLEEVIRSYGAGDPAQYIAIADHFLQLEDPAAAAAALDRAYGLAPDDADLARHRAAILDQLACVEHGLIWRYVPAGTLLMGSETGDPDERPVHPRRLDAFWITDTPLTWSSICALLGWPAPPEFPDDEQSAELGDFDIYAGFKIREVYSRTKVDDDEVDDRYDIKPAVGISARHADMVAARISTRWARYALPTEAQWERAARGGLVGKRYAWGDAAPAPSRCDFTRMDDFTLTDPRALPANGYGIYGMCGGVADWTADIYDALAYQRAAAGDLSPPAVAAEEAQRIYRGGSWIDCADAVTVSFRSARGIDDPPTPTIGMRLIRELGGTTHR